MYAVVNDANRAHFETWALDYPAVQLVSSGCSTNETRPGAVACIEIASRSRTTCWWWAGRLLVSHEVMFTVSPSFSQ